MMQDIFIGVDGGGSKTEAVVQNALGVRLGMGTGGPGNIRSSVIGSWQSVHQAIKYALKEAGIVPNQASYRFHVGLGMAGVEVPKACQEFLKIPHGFHTLVLDSDAQVACLGAHAGADGAIIVVGTGVHGRQIEQGRITQVAGYGFPHSDEGGGAWLGMEAVRYALQAHDGIIMTSPFLGALSARFPDFPALVSWANYAKPADFASLVPFIAEHARLKDRFAERLLQDAARHIDSVWDALQQNRLSRHPLPCCLLGGIAKVLEPYLAHRIKIVLKPRQFNAPEGAILLVKHYLEGKRGHANVS